MTSDKTNSCIAYVYEPRGQTPGISIIQLSTCMSRTAVKSPNTNNIQVHTSNIRIYTSTYETHTSNIRVKTSTSGGARSWNLGGHLRGNTHLGGGQDRISRNLPSPSLPKFLTPWILSIHFFRDFFPDIFNFFQTFKNCSDLPKFFTDLVK